MMDAADVSSEEDVRKEQAEKRMKKRKIRKKRKLAQNLTSYSDSSDEDDDCSERVKKKDDDKVDLKYSISQVPQSFSEIFAEAQSTLRETPDVLLSKYDPSQLPNIDWSSGGSKAHKSRRKSKKARSMDDRSSSEGVNQHDESVSTTNGVESPSNSKKNGTISHVSPDISSSYLSIADMDTDTELNYEEENLPSTSRQASRAPVEDVIVLSSDDEIASSAPNFSFVSRHSFEDSHDPGHDSSDSIVVISSRSPSPEIIVPTSLPPVRKIEDLFQMRIRVRYRNELYEFEGSQNWDTEQVREKLSEATNVPESELLLYTEDDQKMLDGKSLRHYGVQCGDILEALRRSTESPIITDEVVSLKFQKEGLKKPLCLSVPKYSSLKEIRTKVAKILKMEEKKLFFRIDGDTVDLCKTPEELELEDDICVDVFVRK